MIEIVMAIVAWRKGWKGYALIPVLCSFLAGVAAAAADAPLWPVLLAEAVVITALGIMIAHPPQSSRQLVTTR